MIKIFFAKFKSQMLFWSLLASGLCIFRIIENVSNFDVLRILINVFMVFTLSFILYTISYPFIYLFGKLKVSKVKCLLFLFLACAAVFLPIVIENADANQARKGAEQFVRGFLVFVGAGVVADKLDDAIDAAEEVIYDAVYGTAEKIYNKIMYRCPKCGTPGAKSYHSGSGAVNCPAYSSTGGSSYGGSSYGGSSYGGSSYGGSSYGGSSYGGSSSSGYSQKKMKA